MFIAAKIYTETNVKDFWSSPSLLDFLTLFHCFFRDCLCEQLFPYNSSLLSLTPNLTLLCKCHFALVKKRHLKGFNFGWRFFLIKRSFLRRITAVKEMSIIIEDMESKTNFFLGNLEYNKMKMKECIRTWFLVE